MYLLWNDRTVQTGISILERLVNVHTMSEMVEFFDDNFKVGDLQLDPLIFSGRCHTTNCKSPSDEIYVSEFI